MGNACASRRREPASAGGFTLLEVMIVVAIVGVLAAIAYPAYTEYMTRSRIIQATTGMSDFRVKMEQYYQDNRTYANGGNCGVPDPPASGYFGFSCSGATADGFTFNANGLGTLAPAQYRIVVSNATGVVRSTPTPIPGWTGNGACWAIRKDGSCA
jgi:type IV pilus assembly protein PilE